jgi:YesN/AraC family two-component response regulator
MLPPLTDPANDQNKIMDQKILVAEDNDELRDFLQTALGKEYVINGAKDGNMAWQGIVEDPPDLLISDIMMPGMDGFDLCRKVKSTYDTSHIPVILLTSLTGKAEELQGLGLGADDYLTKPFDMALLNQRIKTLLMNRKLIREKAMKYLSDEMHESILGNELNDTFVKKMLEVVQGNIENPDFGKDQFAFEMNVSPSLLYKKSKALLDQSPTDFIKAVRMDHALRLIGEKKYNITEISIMCGFSSIGYFSTVFKNYYGKSPSEYTGS